AVAAPGLVVVERTIRERGRPVIEEAAAGAQPDVALATGAAEAARTAEGLVVRERTAAQDQGSTGGVVHATTQSHIDEVKDGRAIASVAAVTGDRPVGGERAVLHGQGRVVEDAAAVCEADHGNGADGAAVAGDRLVAGESTVGDDRGGGLIIDDGTARGVAAAGAADRLVAAEQAACNGEGGARYVADGAPLTDSARDAEGLIVG